MSVHQKRPRIFQIGFNKCATVSLTKFLISNGLVAHHWDKGEIARKFYERKGLDQDPFADFPDVDAFLDMNFLTKDVFWEAGKDFQYIHRFYPNSYFILNTRNCADWLISRSKHGDFLDRFKSAFGLKSELLPITWTGSGVN